MNNEKLVTFFKKGLEKNTKVERELLDNFLREHELDRLDVTADKLTEEEMKKFLFLSRNNRMNGIKYIFLKDFLLEKSGLESDLINIQPLEDLLDRFSKDYPDTIPFADAVRMEDGVYLVQIMDEFVPIDEQFKNLPSDAKVDYMKKLYDDFFKSKGILPDQIKEACTIVSKNSLGAKEPLVRSL